MDAYEEAALDATPRLGEDKPETTTAYAQRAKPATDEQKERLEEIRALLSDGHASYGDMYQLQVFADEGVIEPGDIDLLEAAGVSEWEATGYGEGNPDEDTAGAHKAAGFTRDEQGRQVCTECGQLLAEGDFGYEPYTEIGGGISVPSANVAHPYDEQPYDSTAEPGMFGDEDGDPEPPEVDPDALYEAARDEAFSDALIAGEPEQWRAYMPGGSKR